MAQRLAAFCPCRVVPFQYSITNLRESVCPGVPFGVGHTAAFVVGRHIGTYAFVGPVSVIPCPVFLCVMAVTPRLC